jgi:NAD(P)-dependent dehydrogenase (short-subunit alcohol dehydrogenase family)
MQNTSQGASPARAWIITGPTSGIGRRTALELASHGTVVLVGRDPDKLSQVETEIRARPGGDAVSVVCDLSDITSVRRAAAEIVALAVPVTGLLNNAGIMPSRAGRSAQGWDLAFATNHLGPFAFTEALVPHLPDGANVVFTCSAVEDPERKPAVTAGFRGGRYISVEASARGEWAPGGSPRPGFDAYATSKQCELAAVLEFARETPRLRFNAVEPGFNPSTGLGRDAGPFLRFVAKYVLAPLAPVIKYWSTPGHAARVLTKVLTGESGETGVYYDENGKPMAASAQVRDPAFDSRVVAETRALLATVPTDARTQSLLARKPVHRAQQAVSPARDRSETQRDSSGDGRTQDRDISRP